MTLEVTVGAGEKGRTDLQCTCERGGRGRLFPNERNPCGWHFQFEALAQNDYSKRVHRLNIDLDGDRSSSLTEKERLVLGSCRFFTLSFPTLTILEWLDDTTKHGNHIFSTPPFPPTLRSLTFWGSWDSSVTQVNNLISLTFGNVPLTSIETVRLLISNNPSLETRHSLIPARLQEVPPLAF